MTALQRKLYTMQYCWVITFDSTVMLLQTALNFTTILFVIFVDYGKIFLSSNFYTMQ